MTELKKMEGEELHTHTRHITDDEEKKNAGAVKVCKEEKEEGDTLQKTRRKRRGGQPQCLCTLVFLPK